MEKLGLTRGVFTACGAFEEPSFVKDTPEIRQMLVDQMKQAVEVAKRVNAKRCTVVPGRYDVGMEHGSREDGAAGEWNVIEAYRQCDDFMPGV